MSPPLSLLLLVTCATFTTATKEPLIVTKCCPLGEHLVYSSPLKCSENSLKPAGGDTETVAALLDRYPTGSLPWMDSRVKVYDQTQMKPTGSALLKGQPSDAYVQYGGHPLCTEPDRQVVSASASYRYKLLSNGHLMLNLSSWGGVGETRLQPEDYCADNLQGAPVSPEGMYVFVTCPCKRVLCIRKCCPPEMAFRDQINGECGKPTHRELFFFTHESRDFPWRPQFRHRDFSPSRAPTHHLMTGRGRRLDCGENSTEVILNSVDEKNYRMWVFTNGSALMDNFGFGVPFGNHHWCGEQTVTREGDFVENAVFCLGYSSTEPVTAEVQTLGVLFLVGAFFLLLTLCVYGVLPELRAPAHAKALMCHSGSLMVGSLTLGSMQLTSAIPEAMCEAGAFIIQFCFLATFFWLNVMCIDISWAFSGFRGLLGSLLDTSRRKFLYYSIYAWGSPLLITTVTVVIHLNVKNVDHQNQEIVVPGIGLEFCWFYGAAAHWAYFYGPIAVLLATNAVLFIFTAVRLALAHCDRAELNRGDSMRHDRSSRMSPKKRRLILYTKLFLLMGVTWLMEVVSWSVEHSEGSTRSVQWWMLIDIINTLRGVFIFLIFCCKSKVIRMLRKKLYAWGLPGGLPPGTGRTHTYRSQASTRQSSSLQLTPSGEDSFSGERRSSETQSSPPGGDFRKVTIATISGTKMSQPSPS